jgi:hypothetical protein
LARDTPPSIQDGEFGFEPRSISNFESQERSDSDTLDEALAKKLGRETWDASTNWINSSRRARWNDSLRAFQNLHPSGSKYLSGDYRFRSTLFRPKTRTMVRRDEAATASAFFANEDVVSISATNDDDPKQQASAEILKALLQYRLANAEGEDRIPWFLTLVGARQDCDVMGICVGKVGWTYEEKFIRSEDRPKMGPQGMPLWDDKKQKVTMESVDIYQKTKDHPFINLISPENFRFEPGCDWRYPVKSSPYLIELVPVYIGEALERMESQHGAPAEWKRVSTSALRSASDSEDDVTRRTRETGRVPGADHDAWKPRDYDIAWTRINVLKWRGQDWWFRTLASSGEILEEPRPLEEVYLHGERPYVVGSVNIETHKTYPSSKVELTNDLQRAANQDWNSRFDNIMLSLQPRQFVREGAGNDINDLRTFMPGKVVMINGNKGEPLTNQVTWDRPPPVDGAAFQEQDRINLDWDDLVGAFTNSSQASSQITQQSATGMHLMSGEASGMNEYELRVFGETFVEPIIRLLVKTEQAYETDAVILANAGKKAQLFQRFGIDQITDELLNAGATVRCNVGIGATNPQMRLRNFATGAQILGSMFGQSAAMGANFQEVSKELFALLGYKDGERFFTPGFDPRVAIQQQQLAKQKGKGGGQDGQAKVQAAQIQAHARLQERQLQAQTDAHVAQMDFQTKQMAEQADTQRVAMKLQNDQSKQQAGFQHDHRMAAHQFGADAHMADMGAQQDQAMAQQTQQHQMGMANNAFAQKNQMANQGYQQDQASQANDFMNQQAIALMQQQHAQGMAQAGRHHEMAMGPPGGVPSDNDGDEGAPPQQQQGTGTGPQHLMISTAKSPEEAAMDRAILQHLQQAAEQSAQTSQAVMQSVQQLAQMFNEGQTRMAHVMGQTMAQGHEKIGSALGGLAHTTHRNSQVNDAMLTALTRKKTVVRDENGKIVGVE